MKLKELVEKYGEYDVGLIETPKGQESEWARIHLFKPKPKSVWNLKDGGQYYYTNIRGDVNRDVWCEGCQYEREVGNAFLTKEEALKDVERRKVEALLLKYGGRRWFKEHKLNWFIALENEVTHEPYVYSVSYRPKQGCIYFDTEEQAQKAISEIGEERIKKALFEVR